MLTGNLSVGSGAAADRCHFSSFCMTDYLEQILNHIVDHLPVVPAELKRFELILTLTEASRCRWHMLDSCRSNDVHGVHGVMLN